MKILVVGGAGYIGSHMVKMLLDQGHAVVTFDNLSSGYRDAVLGGDFVKGDLADRERVDEVFAVHRPDAVMHFASHIQVGESVRHPDKYYQNNVTNTLNLLDAMVKEPDTRYLIVTHNAVTMSRMHRLFGVTMIEKGISRLVSVDLGGAEELLAAE